jgi:hypothetical protein
MRFGQITRRKSVAKISKESEPPEIKAMSAVYSALQGLDQAVQLRVLRYTAEMLGLTLAAAHDNMTVNETDQTSRDRAVDVIPPLSATATDADIEGISAVALKWMKRSGLEPTRLQTLFSLGIDEIDLIARAVPGDSKRERMRNVLLLKGIAAYLGTGVARVAYEQLKEACLHYDAYDATNFAKHLKSFASDVGGTKEAGYTLTPRGLTAATELIKELLAANQA